jgi:hypothetical protein
MLQGRGFSVQSGKLVRSPTKSREQTRNMSNVLDTPTKAAVKDTGLGRIQAIGDTMEQQHSALVSLRRARGSATLAKGTTSRQPEEIAVAELLSTSCNEGRSGAGGLSNNGLEQPKHRGDNFFSGLKFRLVAEARTPVVKAALEEAGGTVVAESSDTPVDFVIVRLVRYVLEILSDHIIPEMLSVEASFIEKKSMNMFAHRIELNAGWNAVSRRNGYVLLASTYRLCH